MLQSGQTLDVALSLAQNARRGPPNSPAIADTLGRIYYQKGAWASSIDSLQEALRTGAGSQIFRDERSGDALPPVSEWPTPKDGQAIVGTATTTTRIEDQS